MKKIAKAIISMGVVLAFAGCSWQIPQTVSVRTNANYSFSLGNFTNDLGDSMDTTSMMGDSSAEGITKYDYFPGKIDKNTQHYLLEKEVLITIVEEDQIDALFGTDDSKSASAITIPSALSTAATLKGLDFNPSTMLAEMKSSFGDDLADKIEFSSVPMYLYCVTPSGLTATATINMCYGDRGTPNIAKREGTELSVLNNDTLSNVPKPNYQTENGTVITNLANVACIGGRPTEIKSLVNNNDASIQEDDQLCIEYKITSLSGTIQKADVTNGITLRLYAVIDLPVRFNVKSDVSLDVSKMSGDSDSGSSSSSSSESSSSEDSEFSKYLDAVNSVTVYYIVYQLPIYAERGMSLSVDLMGDGTYESGSEIVFADKNKAVTDADKSHITLHTETITKMKANSNFKPNFAINLKRGSVFSLPREKKIDMNLELGFETDGTIQVK